MIVKGRITIEVGSDCMVNIEHDPELSQLEVNAAVLEAWRLVVGMVDHGWRRAIQRHDEPSATAANLATEQTR